jgi:hypothetical protein
MNNFSELLATKFYLMIDINGSLQTWDVQLPVKITLDEYLPLTIDGFQIEEWQGQQVDTQWVFDTKVPFYQWKHQATHQGWLFYQNIK